MFKLVTLSIAIAIGAIACTDREHEAKQKADAEARWAAKQAVNDTGRQVVATCRTEVEKYLVLQGGASRVLNWIPTYNDRGEDKSYESVSKTSTGYQHGVLATVSGHKDTLSVNCHLDHTYKLLDLKSEWVRL